MSKYMFVVRYPSDPDKIHIERLEIKEQRDCYVTFVNQENQTVTGSWGVDCFEEYVGAFKAALHWLGVMAEETVEDSNDQFVILKANADCYDANWSDGYTIEESVFGEAAKSTCRLANIGYAVTRLLKDAAKYLREEMD